MKRKSLIKKRTLLFAIIGFFILGVLGGGFYYLITTHKIKADSFTAGVWEQSKFVPVSNTFHQITWGVLNDWSSAASTSGINFNSRSNQVTVSSWSQGLLTTTVLYTGDNTAIATLYPNAGSISSVNYQYSSSQKDIKFTKPIYDTQANFLAACNSQKVAVKAQVVLNKNQSILDFRIQAKQATFSLSGAVTDVKTGAAISGATVSLRGYTTATGSDGHYQLTVPFLTSNSSYVITVTKSGYNNGSNTITDTCGNGQTAKLTLAATETTGGGTTGDGTTGGTTGDTTGGTTGDTTGGTTGDTASSGSTGNTASSGSTGNTGTTSTGSDSSSSTTKPKTTITTPSSTTPVTTSGTTGTVPTDSTTPTDTTSTDTSTADSALNTDQLVTTDSTPAATKGSLLQSISLWSIFGMVIILLGYLIYRYRGIFQRKPQEQKPILTPIQNNQTVAVDQINQPVNQPDYSSAAGNPIANLNSPVPPAASTPPPVNLPAPRVNSLDKPNTDDNLQDMDLD